MVSTKEFIFQGYRIRITRPIPCPHCGYITIIYDYRDRKTKDRQRRVTWFRIPRIICEKCGKVTTVLPAFIPPFKQIVRVNNPHLYEKGGYYGDLQRIRNQ